MSVPALDWADVVARLRAAGCVFAEDEADLLFAAAESAGALAVMVERRVSGEPLEQVVGWALFCGLRIQVDPGVFVPRRRTELLVQQALLRAEPGAVVLDLCCGSGAVAAAVGASLTDVELHAADLDPVAVACARRNVRVGEVYEGDLYAPLPTQLRGRVDLLLANAPYVPTDSIRLMPPEARIHEPKVALDGGDDGLDVQRRVISGAREWLAARGQLLVETSEQQAQETVKLLTQQGFVTYLVRSDELDATVAIGCSE